MIIIPAGDQPVLDGDILAAAINLLGDDFPELLLFYREDAPRLLRQLEDACQSADPASAIRYAHMLKSSSRQLGLLEFSAHAAQAEENARNTSLPTEDLLDQMAAALGRAMEALEEYSSQA